MSDSKNILEKNPDGEYVFTPYGEFLSYYHAHIQLFSKIVSQKNLSPAEANALNQQIKGFITQNIKKTDHFFDQMPTFAGFLSLSVDSLSGFMSKNFLETLSKVQEKLKVQGMSSTSLSGNRAFEKITEEICEKIGSITPEGHRFLQKDGATVLQNIASGEIVSSKSFEDVQVQREKEKAVTLKKEVTKTIVVVSETGVLEELIEKFGPEFPGEKLQLVQEILEPLTKEEAAHSAKQEKAAEDNLLSDVADLSFEEEPSTKANNVEDDAMDDILGLVEEPPAQKPDPIQSFTYKEFSLLIKTIAEFQASKDANGYNNWMAELDPLHKSAVSFRSYVIKESKGEKIPWDAYYTQVSAKTSIAASALQKLKDKVWEFQYIKTSLDQAINEFKSRSPEEMQLLKKAWPHIQDAMNFYPDKEEMKVRLENLFQKIPHPDHKTRFRTVFIKIVSTLNPSR